MEGRTPRRFRLSLSASGGPPVISVVTPSSREEEKHEQRGSARSRDADGEKHTDAPVVLIDQKKISDFWRFRVLFVALLLMINCSTQGVYSLYGLYIEDLHHFDKRAMVDILTAGTVFGMFAFPFGALYDFFGPKIVIAIATLLTALSHLLFALTFGGHIEGTKARYCIFFAMMNWGCYAFDVAVLPAVVTHMPRDRAAPIGFVKTVSALGPSVLSCIFRGFFNDRYDNLMYFIMALVIVIGLVGVWYFDNAPYEVTRIRERRLKLKERFHLHLVRNRYMSQLLPMRRLHLLALFLSILNIYLTVQGVCVAYYRDNATSTTYRGLAIGALLTFSLIVVLLIPVKFLDGATAQDERVIRTAQQKGRELAERQRARNRHNGTNHQNYIKEHVPYGNSEKNSTLLDYASTIVINSCGEEDDKAPTDAGNQSDTHLSASEEVPAKQNEPIDPDVSLVAVSDNWIENAQEDEEEMERVLNSSIFKTSFVHEALTRQTTEEMGAITRQQSTYDNPHIETVTVCGEVFVTPVYETTFLESLTYMDIWMLFYTTLVIWGIGITLTANWNIKIMVATRYTALEYKTYVLIAAMAGVSMAFGRVFIGIYDEALPKLNERFGTTLTATVGLPLPSILMTLALIFYLSFPGNLSLIAVYMLSAAAYGFSTSLTILVISVIFKRDIGMHYGFCFTGAAIGVALFYRVLFFGVYDRHKIVLPPGVPIDTRGACVGDNCMRDTLIVYLVLSFTTIASSYIVHYRYWKLVHGKLKYRRVTARIRDHLRRGEGSK